MNAGHVQPDTWIHCYLSSSFVAWYYGILSSVIRHFRSNCKSFSCNGYSWWCKEKMIVAVFRFELLHSIINIGSLYTKPVDSLSCDLAKCHSSKLLQDFKTRYHLRSFVPDAGIEGRNKYLPSTVSVRCNYLFVPAFDTSLSCMQTCQFQMDMKPYIQLVFKKSCMKTSYWLATQSAVGIFFVVSLHKLLNKGSSWMWFRTKWRWCDVTVMDGEISNSLWKTILRLMIKYTSSVTKARS